MEERVHERLTESKCQGESTIKKTKESAQCDTQKKLILGVIEIMEEGKGEERVTRSVKIW